MTVEVDVPTIPERDELLAALEAHGLAAKAVDAEDHLGIAIECNDCEQVIAEVEEWIAAADLPLVPFKSDGHVYLRPPGS